MQFASNGKYTGKSKKANAELIKMTDSVLPIHKNGEVVGVLDIDSPLPARFDAEDKEGLCKFVEVLERHLGRKGIGAW